MQLDIYQSSDVRISAAARIGRNVRIGARCIIYDNVEIGDNTVIGNDCVLGEPLHDYYSQGENYSNPPTIIGEQSLIRSHTIIYAGNTIGHHFACGHRATLREYNTFGHHCSVGTLDDIQGYATFGNYCRLHSNVHIGQRSSLGNFVFVYPYVVFTNDPTPPSNICNGPTVDDYSQISTGSILLPGVQIGKHCLVGAGAIVAKDVPDYQLAVGHPAKVIKDVRDIIDPVTGIGHYPWPYHFDRHMPWKETGFEAWQQQENESSTPNTPQE